ncbi:MAG: hypothetical protein ABI968_01280 [Acidobacteriota bacterium]
MRRQLLLLLGCLGCLCFLLGGAGLALAQEETSPCPPAGDATKPKLKHLNEQRAREDDVADDDIDDTITMESLSEPGDDRLRWQDGQGVEIVAYVIEVRDGGAASSNCHSPKSADHDTILELVPTSNAMDRAHRVHAIVTPQWRQIVAADRVDWSTGALRAHFLRRWVTVRGWLLFNSEAAAKSLHTAAMAGPDITRVTAWEIHPVTSLELQEDVLDQQAELPDRPAPADYARSNTISSAP